MRRILSRGSCRVLHTLPTSVLRTDSEVPQWRGVDLRCYHNADTLQAWLGAQNSFRCLG